MVKNVAKNPAFELRFQLITVGLDKIYEIIQHNRDALEKEGESEQITEAKMIIIENTCLLMDFIVNFNDIIYAVFKKLKNQHYLGDFLWSIRFTEKYIDLLDELTTKEFAFVKENLSNIINELAIPEYPYENSVKFLMTPEKIKEEKKKRKERRSKKDKGPKLFDSVKFEL